ncbi:hypothetical protein [Cesiribacter andamanensis]|uniref:Lipoprotein n=1 Tax=Cesiribacter andamanensis AMV16 TaxID=1279009 RepID=M7NJ02_9BACT|nr:hypothetical protein [Cesiribacter andamanensis]EMR01735.1 hypothetical protein ADICEAN_03131 [Cesiribacter andamanensis AMV16]
MKRITYTFIACLLIGLSSCLEITEQVHMRSNGSGQFTFTVDMQEAKPLLDMARNFSSEANPEAVKSDLSTGMDEAHGRLQKIKGIHQPTLIKSKDGLLSGITFEFDNVAALNKAINAVQNSKGEPQEEYFAWNGQQLHRLNTLKLENEVKKGTDSGLAGLDLSVNGKSFREILNSMVYRTEYRFDTPIKGVSNSNATLSADKRKVTLERYLLDDSKKAGTLENVIRF